MGTWAKLLEDFGGMVPRKMLAALAGMGLIIWSAIQLGIPQMDKDTTWVVAVAKLSIIFCQTVVLVIAIILHYKGQSGEEPPENPPVQKP